SKQKEHIQTTTNFSILSTKKGKNKVVNYDEEIKSSNTINQLRQTTLNFPSSIIYKKSCSAKTQGQASIEKYFKTSNIELVSKRQSYPCQGLSSDEIKQYVLKCPLDFGGSRNKTELASQKAHASWILDRGDLSVTSTKCKKFTHHESKICDECSRLKNNLHFRDAIST
ncbi:17131_t:CDS:2, partial [Gigaspora margarita]